LDQKVPVRAETAGLVLQASQPNITSLGTLNNLNVTGTVTSGSMAANQIFGVLATPSQPKITQLGALESLSVNYLITTTALTASSITGQLVTAAQPNITSLGTLTGLTVDGTVSAQNISGTLSTAAQPNITSLGTLTTLAVTGNVSGGNVISGGLISAAGVVTVVGNVTGGNINTAGYFTASYVIATDGIIGNVEITDLTTSITPRSTSSKILVTIAINYTATAPNYGAFRITRNGVEIGSNSVGSNLFGIASLFGFNSYSGNALSSLFIQILDSPSTASSAVYKLHLYTTGSGGIFPQIWLNKTQQDISSGSNSAFDARTSSSMILQEYLA
jgi:hypothetical protein